ncbi:hypothetical protein RRG08_050309 [Elysia crispata]|uniref:Uncharacterized protein n=1 Tax=Elysia crispata TaxID=231223 RepID=A0AAE0ZZN0_9GAST|nr:hypothetical protein RRG08_050309 [Elysia crispata]
MMVWLICRVRGKNNADDFLCFSHRFVTLSPTPSHPQKQQLILHARAVGKIGQHQKELDGLDLPLTPAVRP